MDALWQLMAQNGVDVVLTGHEHNYQRWKPMDASGTVSASGMTEFVVGTGGHELQPFGQSDSRVATRISGTNGALKMTLTSTGASYQFVSTSGNVMDSGTAPCLTGEGTDADADQHATPIASGDVTVNPDADSRVDESQPSTNFGTSTTLRTDAGTGVNVESYLRFTVSGVASNVTSAKLRLYVTDGSVDGPRLHDQYGLDRSGHHLGQSTGPHERSPGRSGEYRCRDLGRAQCHECGDGQRRVQLRHRHGLTDGTNVSSRNSSTNKPELVLTIGGTPADRELRRFHRRTRRQVRRPRVAVAAHR